MKEILFVTSNKGKVISLQNRLNPLHINVKQIVLDLIEPQADTCQEISLVKAQQAYAKTGKPVLVDDSAFHIPALNGFPGPYVKYILKTLGGRGILKTAEDITNRHSYFESSLTLMLGENNFKSFTESSNAGILGNEFVKAYNPESWSELWNIFIPYGSSKVFAELTYKEREQLRKERKQKDTYDIFVDWIKKEYAVEN